MTVSTTASRISYTGDDTTDALSFPYPVLAEGDLVVIETVIATGVETTQTITTDYTVSIAGDGSSATVTPVSTFASTTTWTIYRDPAATQSTDFVDNDSLPAASIENALDRLTMIAQRSRDIVTRSLRQPEGDTADISALPTKVDRASTYLAFDADGDPIATAGTTSDITVSTFMETLLDDTTAAAARTTLGAGTGDGDLSAADTSTTFVGNNKATAANIRAGADNVIITPAGVESAVEEVTLSSSSNSVAVDWSSFINGILTLDENTTFAAPSNAEPGTTRIIRVVQGSTGGTIAFNAVYKFPGGTAPTASTGTGAKDTLYIYCETTSLFHVTHQLDFS